MIEKYDSCDMDGKYQECDGCDDGDVCLTRYESLIKLDHMQGMDEGCLVKYVIIYLENGGGVKGRTSNAWTYPNIRGSTEITEKMGDNCDI